MLDDRLLAGRGFAVFSREATFSAGVVERYLHLDRAVKHVVLVHHDETAPVFVERLGLACAELHVSFRPVLWSEYGEPGNVAHVGALPSAGLAFVSVDHHKTVHDRLDVRRGYIRRKAARKKVAVDAIPYEVLPWRVYFPFAFFDRDLLGYHHSYALEQDHEKFLDGSAAEDPCAAERIAGLVWRCAVVDGRPVFARRPVVEEVAASPAEHVQYAVVRDGLFATEKSISAVKSKLARWIQDRHPTRSIPTDLKRVYAPDFTRIVATDLPFDRWLCREITALMDHTDELLRLLAERQREADG